MIVALLAVSAATVHSSDAGEGVVSLDGDLPRWEHDPRDGGGEGDFEAPGAEEEDDHGGVGEDEGDADSTGKKTLSRYRVTMRSEAEKTRRTVAAANKGIAQLRETLKKSKRDDAVAKVATSQSLVFARCCPPTLLC